MAQQNETAAASEATGQGLANALRHLARQPILDLRGRVHGYELLFRESPEAGSRGDGGFTTRIMLDNTIMFGMEKLTRGLPGFVNCTAEDLTEEQVCVLPPSTTVLEIPAAVKPSAELVDACRRLKARGYRLALDDFAGNPELEPLLGIADYVKVDFLQSGKAERQNLLLKLRRHPAALVAKKVETRENYELARNEGFSLFQGRYFCVPAFLSKRKIPPNKIFHFELLEALQEDPLNLRKLDELVKRDPALTYRLMRYVNSPLCAVRQEVRSITSALMMVGDNVFRRIATLAIAGELSAGGCTEVLRMAFIRGRFCELASRLCGMDAAEQYLLGIFSLLPAMLEAPMKEILATLPLRKPVQEALMGQTNEDSYLLQWIEAEETGDWIRVHSMAESRGLRTDDLYACYRDAVVWAEESVPAME